MHFQDQIRWMRNEINRLADNSTNVPGSTMLCIFTKSVSCSFGCQMRDRGSGGGGGVGGVGGGGTGGVGGGIGGCLAC